MPSSPVQERPVLVVDFGSQYVQLIARRVRECGAFARIVRHDITTERVRELNPRALILSGGPSSVYAAGAPHCEAGLFALDVPILAICYGMQLACQALGGEVAAGAAGEYGRALCRVLAPEEPLLQGVPEASVVWMSHGDQVRSLGEAFIPLATTATCPLAAVKHRDRPVYGLQFHPEVVHTEAGKTILANFLDRVCGSPGTWTMEAYLERATAAAAARVGPDERVVCGLSGGVDSAVCAALLTRALGPRVVCVFVDNGLLRGGERDAVARSFGEHSSAELRVIDARDRFLDVLKGVVDPQ